MDFTPLKDFMDRLTAWRMPGNSVCVYYKNEEVFRYSSGYADVETKEPMDCGKYINIYSCTKPSTVVAALQLYEKGYFLLDDPLSEYIPEFREMYIKGADGELVKVNNPITLRHLFTMTAGLTYNMNTDGMKKAREVTNGDMDTVKVAACLADDPLIFEPGTHWNYSLCHDVLGAVVEVISGKPFSEYVKENVFEPCGITKASYHLTPEIEKKLATQYSFDMSAENDIVSAQQGKKKVGHGGLKKLSPQRTLYLGAKHDSGGAGLITTVEDYAKLANALANHGRAKTGERILSRGTVDLLRCNQLSDVQLKDFNWPQLRGYGYGLGVRTLIDKAKSGSCGSLGEFGWGGAAGATILVDPDEEFSLFYAHHMLNPQEDYYQPRLRNVAYMCLGR
ncbi:MAG: beta-lactamase family protein [Ruminococcaceae bacterium]|nr:beta-lactamase family protein [Oscillospiraceae bacterium]